MRPANFAELLPRLARAGVQFIVVGGGAGIAHGLARLTQDVDVVYSRAPENLKRIVDVLSDLDPYPRGAPRGLPFLWDIKTLAFGTNFTLSTTLGYTTIQEIHGVRIRVVTLEKLIELKRAAGRPKDFEVLAELEALLEERDRAD